MTDRLRVLEGKLKVQVEDTKTKIDLVKDYVNDLEPLITELEEYCYLLEEERGE